MECVSVLEIDVLFEEHYGLGKSYKDVCWLFLGGRIGEWFASFEEWLRQFLYDIIAQEKPADRERQLYFVHDGIHVDKEDDKAASEDEMYFSLGEDDSDSVDPPYEPISEKSDEDAREDLALHNDAGSLARSNENAGSTSKWTPKPKWRAYDVKSKLKDGAEPVQ